MLQSVVSDRPVGCQVSGSQNIVGYGHPTRPTPDNTLPTPAYQLGQWVQVEQLANDDDDRPQWYLHKAQICGAQWNPRHREWEYSLYFPKSPCPWLSDGYFDPCTVVDSAIYPLNYRLAA